MALEGSDEDWLRWTSGAGEIVLDAEVEVETLVEGEWLSLERPNSIRIEVNGRVVHACQAGWDLGGFQPLPPIRIRLRKGRNSFRLLSGNKGLRSEIDPRPLAVAVRNLAFRVAACDGSSGAE